LFELLKPELGLSDRFCTVLDVGGGVGQLSQVFAERGHHVCILDIAPTRALHPAMTVRRGQLGELDEGDRFDLILLSHVLEHVWSPSELLKHAYNHLGDKGALFVEVPFELYTPFIKRKLGDPRHVGYFARHTLGRYLEQTGFQVAWVRRDLGLYDTRRIMVLRALAFPAVSSASSFNPWGRLSWLRTPLEMLHPRQVSHVARRTRPSKLRK
jgi:SAM-dependent methyltransferase